MTDTSRLGVQADAVLIAVEHILGESWKLLPPMTDVQQQRVIDATWQAIRQECRIPLFD